MFKKKSVSQDLHQFNYDDLETIINNAGDKIVEITMPDGVRLTIRPKAERERTSLSGRFQ